MIEEIRTVTFRIGNRDCVKWTGDTSNCYSVKSAYKILTEDSNLVFKKVWNKLVPLKVTVFGWQVFQNRIPSKKNLSKRGILDSTATNCTRGCDRVESSSHIFFECNIAYEVWMNICRWLGVTFSQMQCKRKKGQLQVFETFGLLVYGAYGKLEI
jgi:hypothetical protein